MSNLKYNDSVVKRLRSSIRHGSIDLGNTQLLIKKIIEGNLWKKRELTEDVERTGEIITFSSFEGFVIAPTPDGLNTNIDTIRKLCNDNAEILDLIDQATQGKHGNPTGANQYTRGTVDNIHSSKRPDGTSRQRALRKLREAAEGDDAVRVLQQKVMAGQMSPHAAMVKAGLRTKTITVPLDPNRAAKTIARHFTEDQIQELLTLLTNLKI